MSKKPKKFKNPSEQKKSEKTSVTLKKNVKVEINTQGFHPEKKKIVSAAFSQLGKEFSFLFIRPVAKSFAIISQKSFIEFFLQSFLITGVLLLLFMILSLVLDINQHMLIPVKDNYKVQAYPFIQNSLPLSSSPFSYIIYEKKSRVIVDGKNEHYRFSPASSAKMMTALVALEHYDTDTYLLVRNMSSVLGSKMGIFDGEELTVLDLIYGLMLPSGNDAAQVLAQNYPGGVKAFVARMNEKAREYNLLNTHFEDPSGLRDTNYSTAFDLARLASHVLENPTLSDVVKTQSITVSDRKKIFSHKLNNLNELLALPGVTGVKTGFTEEAGGVLVTSYAKNGGVFIMVVLKSTDRFADTQKLITSILGTVELLTY